MSDPSTAVSWFASPVETVVACFFSNAEQGLSTQQVQQLRKQWSFNELPHGPVEPLWHVFVRQFQSPLIYLLLCAAVIIVVIGQSPVDAVVIGAILLFNALIGTLQEGRTRAILQQLSKAIQSDCVVERNGRQQLIKDRLLVPGDIIIVSRGDRIPADARLLSSEQLSVDQALLTGESGPITKRAGVVAQATPVAQQINMIHRGTTVVQGKGRAIVVATGVHTEIGKLGTIAQKVQTDVPIRAELDRFSYIILYIVGLTCSLMFVVGLLAGVPFSTLLMTVMVLFVSVVPEGLPLVLTFVLVRGSQKMAQRKVVVRGMQAVEGLGRATAIVLDKTGTLTLNQMMVQRICTPYGLFHLSGYGYRLQGAVEPSPEPGQAEETLMQLALNGYLVNTAELLAGKNGEIKIKGDPTEAALAIAAHKIDSKIASRAQAYQKQFHLPFHPHMRLHVAGFEHEGRGVLLVNGAPEALFERCHAVEQVVIDCAKTLLAKGLRVIASARASCSLTQLAQAQKDPEAFVTDHLPPLFLLGVSGIADAIRPGVSKSVAQARQAGLKVIMATGDHVKTAEYVARETGLLTTGDQVMRGAQTDALSQKEYVQRLAHTTVFARMDPHEKLRLVQVLQSKGNIVAMTGDGVNDVPAIVAADLGIAMGTTGAQVTKYAADMVLYDDSFSNILYAITFGRHIFYTLQRVIVYFFSTNLAELLIIVLALLAGLPMPLTAAQILWLNFITDGFLDIGLACEPIDTPVLRKRSWVEQKQQLVSRNLLYISLYLALPMIIGSLWLYTKHVGESLAVARTIVLVTMALFQWFNAWNCRSLFRSLFMQNPFSNFPLIAATVFVAFLQWAVVYVPFMQALFKTVPLSIAHWFQAIALASTIIIWSELRKFIVRRRQNG